MHCNEITGEIMNNKVVPFSHLALGCKFKYISTMPCNDLTFVKISNDRTGGCIAEWDDDCQTVNWVGQGIYSLNDDGIDIDVEAVIG